MSDILFTAAFVFGITIYITVTLPGLERVVLPTQSDEEVVDKAEALRVMCAGNVLTSQRIVDVVLKAFNACAASQGCTKSVVLPLLLRLSVTD